MKLEVHAKGPGGQSLTLAIDEGETRRIGRMPVEGTAIPWDMTISHEHADLSIQQGAILIRCVDAAKHPIKFQGKRLREVVVPVGGSVGIGRSTFQVVAPSDAPGTETEELLAEPELAGEQHAFSAEELRKAHFANTEHQLEILSQLPAMISKSQSDEELAVMLVDLLLEAIPQAEATAVVQFAEDELMPGERGETTAPDLPNPKLMRVATRDDFTGRFLPSRRLIKRVLTTHESVMHIWTGEGSERFTMSRGLRWAVCAPIPGESCLGWCLYVSGAGTRSGSLLVNKDELKGELRFTELVAQFIGSVRQVRVLEEYKTQLSSFFSPNVIESLTDRDARDLLVPAEREITVLFCDVRGFSRKSEQLQDDLHALLRTDREALGVMTNSVIDRDGAIADFQGDSVLGFWGWPVPQAEGALPACRAASAIHATFRSATNDPTSLLQGFSVGIGIAHGQALAGQIGTKQQAKVGVFGPVVNQGSRLEGMTKQFAAPICIDETSANFVRQSLSADEGRLRRLARVRPIGMDMPITVFGLLPSAAQYPQVSEEAIAKYDAALDAVIEGRWSEAVVLLGQLPADDEPATFLRTFLAEQEPTPPDDWDGVISLSRK